MTIRNLLRQSTRDLHDRLDNHFAHLDISEELNYIDFLRFQHAARKPVELWLATNHSEAPLPPAQFMLIEMDLADLGVAIPPPAQFQAPSRPDALGAAWALAGSHLGNLAMLKTLPHGNRLPTRFLSDPRMRKSWKDLQPALSDSSESSAAQRALQTARSVFDCFLAALPRDERKIAA